MTFEFNVRNLNVIDEIVDLISNFKLIKVFITKCFAHTGISSNERDNVLAKKAVENIFAQLEINKINHRTAYRSLTLWH